MGQTLNVGILTGGGDCPGLNAVIRAVVRKSLKHGWRVTGFLNGWKGVIDGNTMPLTEREVSGILPRGGTILGTSRTNPFKNPGDAEKIVQNLKKLQIDALIVVGGEDTLGVALKLSKMGVHVIGVPKTIDNDICGTDTTFGFDTATQIVTEAIDRLHTTAESHHRIMVLEVMGRHTGWIATVSGIAGGADEILVPEVPFELDTICKNLECRMKSGKGFSIVVVAEGAKPKSMADFATISKELDEFGHVRLGGIGQLISKEIEKRLGVETRVTVLGHVQRGGTPTAYDRLLATRFGIAAVDQVAAKNWGKMVAFRGYKIVPVDISEGVEKLKTVDMELFNLGRVFFGDPCERFEEKPAPRSKK